MIVEVRDDGYGIAASTLERGPSHMDEEYGRGLLIVRSLSERCETFSREEGTVVRCRIALPPSRLAAARH